MSSERYKFPAIDCLRAVAVLAVILNHLDHGLFPGGFLGVDVFFVISGFVITKSLQGNLEVPFKAFLLEFYVRRFKRLMPALIFCVLLTSILLCLLTIEPMTSLKTGGLSLVGLSNLYLLRIETDYFAQSAAWNAFTHTWSLGVEEQFYFIFPFMMYFLYRRNGSFKFTRVVTVLCLLSFVSYAVLSVINRHAAFYLMPTRFWELGAGSLGWVIYQRYGSAVRLRLLARLAFPALLLMLCLPAPFMVLSTALVVGLTLLLIIGTDHHNPPALFKQSWLLQIGQMSYSLYLWHWSVIVLSRWTIDNASWRIPACLVVTGIFALISYRLVERPLRDRSWAVTPLGTLGMGLSSATLAVCLLVGLFYASPLISLEKNFPSTMFKNLEKSKYWGKVPDKGCHVSVWLSSEIIERCLTKKLQAPKQDAQSQPLPRFFVFGDSHAMQYESAFVKLLPSYQVISLSIGAGCGYMASEDITAVSASLLNCSDYKKTVDEMLNRELRSGDVVFVAHRWHEKQHYPRMEQVLAELGTRVAARGGILILPDDNYEITVFTPLLCESRPWRPYPVTDCFRTKDQVFNQQKSFDDMRQRLSAQNAAIQTPTIRTIFCERDDACSAFLGDMPIHSDANHITKEAAMLAARVIVENLASGAHAH